MPIVIGNPCGTISIHSPRMGRDPTNQRANMGTTYFNPLSPHGERQLIAIPYE